MSDFGWMKWDRCFCNEDCGNIKCYRNYKQMPKEEAKYPHTVSMLRGIEGECEGYITPMAMVFLGKNMCDEKEKKDD